MIIHSYCRANKIFRQSIDNNKREDLRLIAFPSPALFRNKRFILSKGFQWNTSKICSYSCSIAKFVVFQRNISSTFNHWFLKSVSSLLLILPLLVTYISTYLLGNALLQFLLSYIFISMHYYMLQVDEIIKIKSTWGSIKIVELWKL